MGTAPVEEFITGPRLRRVVAQKNKGPGIQSAAGLIRYFDAEEESSIKLSPTFVLVFSAVVGVAAVLMRVFWRL